MGVTLENKIYNLECYQQYDQYSDVVMKVGWSIIGSGLATSGPLSGSIVSYSLPVTTDLAVNSGSWNSGSFVPFNQLTSDIVMGWVFNQIGEQQKDNMEQYVVDQTNQLISPTIVSLPLPWQSSTNTQ
mgnify:CR=1 FL=1